MSAHLHVTGRAAQLFTEARPGVVEALRPVALQLAELATVAGNRTPQALVAGVVDELLCDVEAGDQ